MKCTGKTTLWQGEAGFSAIATSLLLRRSAWHFFYYVLPDTRRIKRINKDMKLILYSPGIWVIHIEEHIHNMIAMQNKQMTICENISGPPVDPTDIFATRMLIHTSSLV